MEVSALKDENSKIHTDLACERYRADTDSEGVKYQEKRIGNLLISELIISDEKSAREQGISKGRYTTLFFSSLSEMQENEENELIELLSEKLKVYAKKATKKDSLKDVSVLIAGLGNIQLTADAVGPLCARYITATRHVSKEDPVIFERYFKSMVSVISPGVLAQTGIESFEIISSLCKKIDFDLIIAIDSLAARSCDRLATTIQISDTGITPGSGIGNSRVKLDRESLGVPVIAIGVPTVVESRTLIYDAIAKAKSKALSQEIERILSEESSFFVSPKDSDVITENAAKIISSSINSAFNAELFL
jgi:spore protease